MGSLLTVIVNDFNFFRTGGAPYKADSVALVDPNAMLPLSVTGQHFQMIARWRAQGIQRDSIVQLLQFTLDGSTKLREPWHGKIAKHFLGVFAFKGCIGIIVHRWRQGMSPA